MPTVASILSAPWRYWVAFMDWQTGQFGNVVSDGLRHLYGTLALLAIASLVVLAVETGEISLEFGVVGVAWLAFITFFGWLTWVLATFFLIVPHLFLEHPSEGAMPNSTRNRSVEIVSIWTAFAGVISSIAVGFFDPMNAYQPPILTTNWVLASTFLPQLFRWTNRRWGFRVHPPSAVGTFLIGYALAYFVIALGLGFGSGLNRLLLPVK